MKVSWTDSEKGRQFWVWCDLDQEWVKDIFVTWSELKSTTL